MCNEKSSFMSLICVEPIVNYQTIVQNVISLKMNQNNNIIKGIGDMKICRKLIIVFIKEISVINCDTNKQTVRQPDRKKLWPFKNQISADDALLFSNSLSK